MRDPVLDLLNSIVLMEAACDAAERAGDWDLGSEHNRTAIGLRDRLSATLPTTREGAAALLVAAADNMGYDLADDNLTDDGSPDFVELAGIVARIRGAAVTDADRSFLLFHAAHPTELMPESEYSPAIWRNATRFVCRPSLALAA